VTLLPRINGVPATPRRRDRDLIRARIRDAIFRKRGGLIRGEDVSLRDSAALLATPQLDAEAIELERDVERMHDLHVLDVGTGAEQRPLLRPLIASMRRAARAVLRPMLGHQSAYNGAASRAVSTLRNRAIRQERIVLGYTSALLEIERTNRTLERELSQLGRRALNIDQFAFANAFRGTEDSVKAHQREYVSRFAECGEVVDLGCGRGEFLELLREASVAARGIELDIGMIEHCRAKGLAVEQRDILEYLSGLPDESVGGFFAARMIERLPAFELVQLVREAGRALEPGGVLLVESFNPESPRTFAEFYVDPTHVRPYHPHAIRWLFEQEGFVGVEVQRSVEPESGEPLCYAVAGAAPFAKL
jgi:SAM-dependent methyltransferase